MRTSTRFLASYEILRVLGQLNSAMKRAMQSFWVVNGKRLKSLSCLTTNMKLKSLSSIENMDSAPGIASAPGIDSAPGIASAPGIECEQKIDTAGLEFFTDSSYANATDTSAAECTDLVNLFADKYGADNEPEVGAAPEEPTVNRQFSVRRRGLGHQSMAKRHVNQRVHVELKQAESVHSVPTTELAVSTTPVKQRVPTTIDFQKTLKDALTPGIQLLTVIEQQCKDLQHDIDERNKMLSQATKTSLQLQDSSQCVYANSGGFDVEYKDSQDTESYFNDPWSEP